MYFREYFTIFLLYFKKCMRQAWFKLWNYRWKGGNMVQKYSAGDLKLIAIRQIGQPFIDKFVDEVTRRFRPWIGSQKLRRFVNSAGKGIIQSNLSDRDLRYLAAEVNVLMRKVTPVSPMTKLPRSYRIIPKFNSMQVVGGDNHRLERNVVSSNNTSTLKTSSTNKAKDSHPGMTNQEFSSRKAIEDYNLSDWIRLVKEEADLYPLAKSVVTKPNVIRNLMILEGGIRGGEVNPGATNGSYHGPFQFGVDAWNTGVKLCKNPTIAENRSKYYYKTKGSLRVAFNDKDNNISPRNPSVMIPIALAYWENNLAVAMKYLGSSLYSKMVSINPLGLLYLGHNIGSSFYQSPYKNGSLSAGGRIYSWKGVKEGQSNPSYDAAVSRYLSLQSGDAQHVVQKAIKDMYGYVVPLNNRRYQLASNYRQFDMV